MSLQLKCKVIIVFAIITFIITPVFTSFATDETVTYTYDEMLRVIKAEYGDGTVVEYVYDNLGNRFFKTTSVGGTPANTPPNTPANPSIPNGATNVSTTPTLGWTGGDPDPDDEVIYYVYFGESGDLALVTSGAQTSYEPLQLQGLTEYCWQITAKDTHNAETTGPVWCFSTRNDQPVAEFTADPTVGLEPLQVGFWDASTSSDDVIVSWEWDVDNNGTVDSTKQNFSYTYTTPGTYTVSLTVTDAHGSSDTETKIDYITVQTYGSISGTVTDESTGTGIEGIKVRVSDGPSAGSAMTDASGNYTISGLALGDYKVHTDNALGYVDEYYDNADWFSATLVTVSSGTDTPNIDFTLTPPGSISGRVTDETTGSGIANVYLRVTYGSSNSYAYTDVSGNYTITNLEPGDYKVYTSSTAGYADEYYNDADLSSATLVTVSSGTDTPNIHFALTPTATSFGSLSGRVTDELTGLGIEGVKVYVSNGPSYGSAKTDIAGNYRITNLDPGQYKVHTSGTTGYVDEYYNDADSSTATLVMVNSSTNTPNINFALTPVGSISGRVIDELTGTEMEAVTVSVSGGPSYGYAVSDASGVYTIEDLHPGQYKVYSANLPGYADEYYENADSSSATLVTVNPGADTPNINLTLAPVGSISGRVTDEQSGLGIGGVTVRVSSGPSSGSVVTDASGNYTIPELEPGEYKVYTSYTTGYVDEYYENADFWSATFVTVNSGSDTPNVNFALAPLGSLSGRVTDEQTGLGIADVTIRVSSGPSSGSASTNVDGSYTIPNLEPGDYKVYSSNTSGYIDEYYDDANSSSAALVTVNAGANTPGIDFALTPDADDDGIPDSVDNCPSVANADQADMNENGVGDVCDSDIDGDGILNDVDNCVIDVNPDQADINNDGYGDACTVDHCVSSSAELQQTLREAVWNDKNDVIQLVQGTYRVSENNNNRFSYHSSEPYSLLIRGGYSSDCSTRELDPVNTILDGEGLTQVAYFIDGNSSLYPRVLRIEGVTIRNGQYALPGPGMHLSSSNGEIILANTIIINNHTTGSHGGGVYVTAYNEASVIFINNIFSANKADVFYGGGTYILSNDISLINNTIIGNSGGGRGGGIYLYSTDAVQFDLYNNIIWGNTATSDGDDIYLAVSEGVVNGYHNNFDPAKIYGTFSNEEGNINTDPLVVDPANGNYHLSADSPCINAGENTAPHLPAIDFEGDTRIFGAAVDLGADEYLSTGPEIKVKQGMMTIPNAGGYDFGSVNLGSGIPANFTVENLGMADLTLGEVQIAGTHAGDFQVITQPTSPVVSGASTTFDIRFSPGATGIRTATVSLSNNDADENPYTFTLTGASPPQYTLTVIKAGTGTGTVTSNPAGIDCGMDCTETYSSGTLVTLTATSAIDSVFTGWSGAGCSGTGDCVVTMDTNKIVTANFIHTGVCGGTDEVLNYTIQAGETVNCRATNSIRLTPGFHAEEGSTFRGYIGNE